MEAQLDAARGERFTDRNGQHLIRRSLGHTKYGLLVLKPALKSPGCVDVIWQGNPPEGAFDFDLQRTIRQAWERLRRGNAEAERVDAQPLRLNGVYRWWLCRLPRGRYMVEARPHSGYDLFAVWVDDRPPPSEQPAPSDGPIYYPGQLSE